MSKKGTASVSRVALFNMLGPVVLNGLSFFTMPLFTRLLGTENYGSYTVYLSYYSVLVVLIGFQAAGAIAPASVCYEGRERDRCFSNIMTMALASAVLIGGLMLAFAGPLSAFTGLPRRVLAVMFFHALGGFVVSFSTAKFSYDKNSFATFLISVLLSVVSIGLSLVLIFTLPAEVPRYEGYVVAHAVPYVLAGVVLAALLLARGRSLFVGQYWRFALCLCLPLIFHQLSNTVLHQCDKVMLDKLQSTSAAGIYGFAVTFANILNIVWAALNTTWVPFYHDDVKAGRLEELSRKTGNYCFLFTCLTLGFVMAMPEVVKLFGQRDFWPSMDVIPLLALGFYFVFLYSFPVNFEFYYRRTRIIAAGTCLAALANIGLNYVLIPLWGMVGAAVATTASYALLWVFHLFLSHRVIREPYHFRYRGFYAYLGITAAGIALFYAVRDLWYVRWPLFFVLAALVVLRVRRQKSIF